MRLKVKCWSAMLEWKCTVNPYWSVEPVLQYFLFFLVNFITVFLLVLGFQTVVCLPLPRIPLIQRWSAAMLKTMGTSPPVAHRSNPRCQGPNKGKHKRHETPLDLSPPMASKGHQFSVGLKQQCDGCLSLKLFYPLSYLVSTPKGDNRVEEQGLNSLLVNFRGKF